jgi:hypothetical protein
MIFRQDTLCTLTNVDPARLEAHTQRSKIGLRSADVLFVCRIFTCQVTSGQTNIELRQLRVIVKKLPSCKVATSLPGCDDAQGAGAPLLT